MTVHLIDRVSRTASKTRMRARLLTTTILLGGAVIATQALAGPAQPSGGQVVAGQATIATSGATTTVTQSAGKAIIDWSSFSIGRGGEVDFNNGSGATLNRVTGGSVSSLDGLLKATGSVYLINPNGVIIGKSGVVQVGGSFVASALDLSDSQFLSGGDLTFAGPSTASVVNLGQIGALGGDVSLLALNVRNDGAITADNGAVGLAAGRQIILRDTTVDAGKLLVITGGADTAATNTGTIEAAAAELRAEGGNVYALAGNTQGVIRATGVSANDGKIWLTAGTDGSVKVAGTTLAASDAVGNGGAISVTGGQVAVASDAMLDASATAVAGNGGTVSVIADKTSGALTFAGTALARGGVTGGLGGFVETSGHTVDFAGARIATAGAGHTGNWLIDPYDLTIDASAASAIETGLSGGNVLLQTTASSTTGAGTQNTSGQGDIVINADIAWNTGSVLTLDAYHSVLFNANVSATGAGGVVIETNHGGTGGDYYFAQGKSLSLTTAGSLAIGDSGATPTGYTLVADMTGFQGMDGASGNYALVNDIASAGSYTSDPVGIITAPTVFTGLGHTIDGLTITSGGDTGLIYENDGVIRDLGVTNVNISETAGSVAGVIDYNFGNVQSVYTTGTITSDFYAGGIAAYNSGTIRNSFSSADVTVNGGFYAGGLVGQLDTGGVIIDSYATGTVSAPGAYAGGLVGINSGTIFYSYATGAVSASGGASGGIVGVDGGGVLTDSYWDATATGQTYSTGGGSDTTGAMTTADLQNGTLPTGFDSSVWSVSVGGYPYLTRFNNPSAPTVAQIISGTAYNPDGSVASGASISIFYNGAQLGTTATSDVNGLFSVSLSSVTITTSTEVGADLVLSSGTHVSGLIFIDAPTLSSGNLTNFNVTSGKVNLTTALTSWSALQTALSNTFGSATYTTIKADYGTPDYVVSAGGAFTFDQVLSLPGALTVTATSGVTLSHNLTTSGAQTYNDAVTLASDVTLAAGSGAIGFTSTLDSDSTARALTLSTSGTQTFGGAVGGAHALASLATGSGAVDVDGAITTNGATGQVYNGAVVLGADTILTAGTGAIDFVSTLDSNSASRALTLSTSGTQTFGGVVGGSHALTSLATGTGTVDINTTGVTTSGVAGQVYNGAVVLGAGTTLTAGSGAIDFTSTLNSDSTARALSLSTTGTQTFGGVVGGVHALASLATGTGTTDINTTGITTSGLSGYNGAVVLGADTTLTAGGALTFGSTVNGGHGLTLSGTSLTFDGSVGGSTHLTSLSGTATGGDIDVDGQITTTSGIFLAANGNFVNTAGATALNPGTAFTVYTQNASNPAGTMPGDTWDGLTATNYYNDAYDFTHATFASAVPTGNHFVYAYQASVTPTLSGAASKTYDSLTTASTSGLTLGGTLLAAGDSVTFGIGSASFDNQNAGSGKTVTASGITLSSNPNNYTLASTTASAAIGSIAKAALTLSAVTDTKTYDATATSTKTIGSSGLKGTDSVTATQSFDSDNAGTRTLSVNSGYVINDGNNGGNYTVTTQMASGTIAKAALTLAAVADSKTYDATATSIKTVGISGLKGSDSVTATQSFDSDNAGTRTLSVNGGYVINDGNNGGNYTVTTQTASGTIAKAALTLAAVTDSKTYDATATSDGTVGISGLKGSDSVTATQSFDSDNAGARTLSVNGGYVVNDGNNGGNYTVTTQTASGTIAKAALTLAAVADSKTYDATATSDGTVGISGLKGSDSVTATQSFDSDNAGARTLSVNGGYVVNDGNNGGNYTVTTQTASGTIAKAALTLAAMTDSKTYDATATSDGTVGISGLKGSDSVTATQSFDSDNAGTRTLSVNGGYVVNDGNNGGNYTVTTQTASGTIAKAALTLAAMTDSKTYDATATSDGTVGISGLKGSDSVTATQSFDSDNAGTRTLSVNGGYVVNDGNNGGNYTVTTQTASGTIAKAALTLAAMTDAKTYDATATSDGTVGISGLKGSDSVTATQSFDSDNAGTRTLSVNGGYVVNDGNNGGNYTVTTQTASGTIAKAALTLTASGDSKTYDATTTSSGTVGVSGLKGADTVTGATQAFDSKNAGSRTLDISGYTIDDGNGGGNYTVTTQGAQGTIAKATLTAGLAGTVSKTYDATLSATLAAGNYSLSGIKGSDMVMLNDPLLGIYANANAGAGKTVSVTGLALSGTDAGNYSLASTNASAAIGAISAAPLTLTAANESKIIGSADPLLAYAVTSGQLYGSDTLSGSLVRAAGEQPGGYAITQGTLSASANYAVTFVGAVFTIQPTALQNLPVVNPVENGASPGSDPQLSPPPSTNGGVKASGPTVTSESGPPPSACQGGDSACLNVPYPGNATISSQISFLGQ